MHESLPSYAPPAAYEPVRAYAPAPVYEAARVYEPVRAYAPAPVYEAARVYEPVRAYEPAPVHEPVPAPVDDRAPVYEAVRAYEPARVYEPAPVDDRAPVYEAVRAYEPARVYQPAPVYEAVRAYEPAPVHEPVRAYDPAPAYELPAASPLPTPDAPPASAMLSAPIAQAPPLAPTPPPRPATPPGPPGLTTAPAPMAPPGPATTRGPAMAPAPIAVPALVAGPQDVLTVPPTLPPVPHSLPPVPPPPVLRWRRIFPGQEAELRRVRSWLAELLPSGPAREDVVTVAIELAANAVRHTASGGHGFFAVELTWQMQPVTVRVAVADGGARTTPHLMPGTDPLGPGPLGIELPSIGPLVGGSLSAEQLGSDQLSEHGRGLRVVRALAERTGVCGDHRGRLVWAEIGWTAEGAAQPEFPDGYEASLQDIQAVMVARYPEADIWFGRVTMQWWAMIGRPEKGHPEARRLLTAESPVDLAQLLDVARATAPIARGRSRGRHGLTGSRAGPRSGRAAGQQAWAGVRAALAAPPRIQPRFPPVTRAVRARFEAR